MLYVMQTEILLHWGSVSVHPSLQAPFFYSQVKRVTLQPNCQKFKLKMLETVMTCTKVT